MDIEINRIHTLLQHTYRGNAWHGSSVMETLQDVTAARASERILPGCHTIWELVLHITSWRNFAWHKLSGNDDFDILTPEDDWPPVKDTSGEAWQLSLQALEKSQQDLLQIIKQSEDKKLEEKVPGRAYTFYVLLHGIIQHDLYHTGQMAILKKGGQIA